MQFPKQLSIGNILVWTLVAALITSHVVKSWPQSNKPFFDVFLRHGELFETVSALDPSAEIWASSGQNGGYENTIVYQDNDVFVTEIADGTAILSHIQTSVISNFRLADWKLLGRTNGRDQRHVRFSKGNRIAHVYLWTIPLASPLPSLYQKFKADGKNVTKIRMLQIGHYCKK